MGTLAGYHSPKANQLFFLTCGALALGKGGSRVLSCHSGGDTRFKVSWEVDFDEKIDFIFFFFCRSN